jgi:acyl carrier protein
MSDTYSRMTAILTERIGVSEDKLGPATTFEHLGLDSLDYITLTLALESEFGVAIGDEELGPDDTLSALVSLLDGRQR